MTLANLRALAEAATKGPWDAEDGANAEIGLPPEAFDASICSKAQRVATADGPNWEADSEYIAATDPGTVLALLDTIEELRVALETARLAQQVYPPLIGLAFDHTANAEAALSSLDRRWKEASDAR